MRLPALLLGVAALVGALTAAATGAEPSQQEKQFEKEGTPEVKIKYLLYLPPGYDKDQKKWPLILFLHGAGESGDDLAKVKIHGPPELIENKTMDFPCIVVSPQSPGHGWKVDVLTALLDDIESHYRVDKDRVYLTGLSMGGYGTWALAAAHPDRFAAAVPICGGGKPADAPKLKDLPIWVFHGAKDPVVPLERSEKMVEALKEAGGNVKFTVYPDAGHDAWTATYKNPELYRWLFAQKRGAGK